jgi:hypothetical protein
MSLFAGWRSEMGRRRLNRGFTPDRFWCPCEMSGLTVSILVDYEGPLAREVAGKIWPGLSVAAVDNTSAKATALWESLTASKGPERLGESRVHIFVVGQERPDAIDGVRPVGDPRSSCLYGVVVAVPELPNPLAGSLLYQGVERLVEGGVKTGTVEPALLRAFLEECASYANRLLERLSPLLGW